MKKEMFTDSLIRLHRWCVRPAQISLSGKVVDARTGKPVEGANVRFGIKLQ